MSKTRLLAYNALLIALSIVATRLFSLMIPIGGIGAVRLGFGPVPIILSGVLFGPLWGGMVGLIADVLGYVLNPMGGAFLPQITLISVLHGVIPALWLSRLDRRGTDRPYTLGELAGAVVVTRIVLGLVATPLALYQALGVPLAVNIPIRAVTQAFLIPAYIALIWASYRPMHAYLRAQAGLAAASPRAQS